MRSRQLITRRGVDSWPRDSWIHQKTNRRPMQRLQQAALSLTYVINGPLSLIIGAREYANEFLKIC